MLHQAHQINISYGALTGALRAISEADINADLPVGPFNRSEWNLLRGSKPWIGIDRPTVVRMLEDISQGSLELLGLPRIQMSAEHLAACIAFFSHPINFVVGARWMEREEVLLSHEDIALGAVAPETERITADQLFALIECCYGSENFDAYRTAWEVRTKLGLSQNESAIPPSDKG